VARASNNNDVRGEILRVATKKFAAHGFDGTSLKAIADDVGIRKPSLLYHFSSKETLRLAVLDQLLDRWNEVLPKLLMAAAGGGPRFTAVIRELVSFFIEDPDRARLLLREILDRPDDMQQRLSTHVAPWVGVVAEHIRQGQRDGDIHRQVDPEAYVLQIINMVVGGIATTSSLASALLPEDAPEGPPVKRHARELERIAGFSLFRAPPKTSSISTHPAPSTEEERISEGS